MPRFFLTNSHYGGDINIIERAAKDFNTELIAVKGYALADFPGPRDYVEGPADYLFSLERNTMQEARQTVYISIQIRTSEYENERGE